MSLNKTIQMTNEFCNVLTDIERNGICIDLDELARLKEETELEIKKLYSELYLIAEKYLGDTPFKLTSSEDVSQLIYSVRVKDKKQWKELFHIDSSEKPAYRKFRLARLTKAYFNRCCKQQLVRLKRTAAEKCVCNDGKIFLRNKDGNIGKRYRRCDLCSGTGIVYKPTDRIAGFKFPLLAQNVSANGFNTDKKTLKELIKKYPNNKGVEFIKKYMRYNALTTYLSMFVIGIEKACIGNILHPQLNQCTIDYGGANTFRLSSREPNVQNIPRGDTFPIRRVVVSRFNGGKIIEADYAQLEFRVAAFLAQDKQAMEDIKNGVDIHSVAAEAMGCTRQQAKEHTFGPLFGRKYDWGLLSRYPRIAKWHEELQRDAIKNKEVILPTGRVLKFPYAKLLSNGNASGATKIKNYPVQCFAGAEIVPAACVRFYYFLKQNNLKALLVNTVHDSLVVDCPPEEVDEVSQLLWFAMKDVDATLKEKYGFVFNVPLDVEVKIGNNWLDTEELKIN